MRLIRGLSWIGTGALVVLGARTLVYALSPSPFARMFEHQAGGPSLPLVAVAALAAGLGIAVAVVALAAIGVRERALLASVSPPRLRLGRLAVRAALLFVVTCFAFAMFESYIHWRAGLGWHGLHCLTGPVHRDAIPILGALSLIAAALAAALDHVLAWMRRTIERIRAARLRFAPALPAVIFALTPVASSRFTGASLGARGPPLPVS
jgi:hypothetical protein